MQMTSLNDIMQMEARLPTVAQLHSAWGWLVEGLGVFCPPALRRLGMKPHAVLLEKADDDGFNEVLIEKSWLGETRLSTTGIPDHSLPAILALTGSAYYQTELSLPKAAGRTLTATVGLRLQDISPIPPEDATFAVGKPRKSSDGRITAPIAIARKSSIAGMATLSDRNIAAIGAKPDRNGNLQFIFECEKTHKTQSKLVTPSALLVLAAFTFLFTAFDFQLSKRLRNMEAYETDIRAELQTLRPIAALLDNADGRFLMRQNGTASQVLFGTLSDRIAYLPGNARIIRIESSKDQITVSGFIPAETVLSEELCNQRLRTPSDRPGFDTFNCTIELEIADE